MIVAPTRKTHRRRRATLLLACALSLPVSMPAQAVADDMFSVMFRMMMVMMNVMSSAMLNNSNSNWGNNLGGFNSFNMGMGTLPMMSGFGSPMSSFGSSPWGMSPWNSPGMSPWGGTPWNSFGSSPWNNPAGMPWSGNQGNPYGGGYDYPANWGAPGYGNEIPPPNTGTALLDGRWFGNSGEVLEIRGNRFQLRTAGAGIGGALRITNNIVSLYSPQTNTVTHYSFMRNQSQLFLSNDGGTVLTFRKHPADNALHTF
jgi:hypothetical protein